MPVGVNLDVQGVVCFRVTICLSANCGPGFGINGNKCSPCGFGSYKTTTGNTQCDECPGSMLTLSTGGNTPENCSSKCILRTWPMFVGCKFPIIAINITNAKLRDSQRAPERNSSNQAIHFPFFNNVFRSSLFSSN